MNIKGKIIIVCPMQEGVSQNGSPWKKQGYLLETLDKYPRRIYFEVFGQNILNFDLQEGKEVDVDVDITSREYNGKYYTSITAYRLNGQAQPQPIPQPTPQPQQQEQGDLPF